MASFRCICKYNCGTEKAFNKHLAKFEGAEAADHGPDERTQQMAGIRKKFHTIDKDKDKALDFTEMAVLLRKGNPHMSNHELQLLFDNADKDGSGQIDFDEFVDFIFSDATDESAVVTQPLQPLAKASPKPAPAAKALPVSRQRENDPEPAPMRASVETPPRAAAKNLPVPKARPMQAENNSNLASTWSPGAKNKPRAEKSPCSKRLDNPVRLLLVRHARSANKEKGTGGPSADPELSFDGYEQAEALGKRLQDDLKKSREGDIIVASSPMQRCILTILPTVGYLQPMQDGDVRVHGGSYEFRCAGTNFRGTPQDEIEGQFPDFYPVGFADDGRWDYRGDSEKENEPEARERTERVVEWIWEVACELSNRDHNRSFPKTLILSTHQTMADLICQRLIDGTTDEWAYGQMKYKLQNTGITEIHLDDGGSAKFGKQNKYEHLMNLGAKSPTGTATPGGGNRSAKEKAKLRAEFMRLDISNDGRLDFEEMKSLLSKNNAKMDEDELLELFSEVDADGKGDIAFDEFLEYIFGSCDESGDASVNFSNTMAW